MENKRIRRALVSVFHKDGLDEILRLLHEQGVELLSTGGTQAFIESLGIPCRNLASQGVWRHSGASCLGWRPGRDDEV